MCNIYNFHKRRESHHLKCNKKANRIISLYKVLMNYQLAQALKVTFLPLVMREYSLHLSIKYFKFSPIKQGYAINLQSYIFFAHIGKKGPSFTFQFQLFLTPSMLFEYIFFVTRGLAKWQTIWMPQIHRNNDFVLLKDQHKR